MSDKGIQSNTKNILCRRLTEATPSLTFIDNGFGLNDIINEIIISGKNRINN